MTFGAETRENFRTPFHWTPGRTLKYPAPMNRRRLDMTKTIAKIVRVVAVAGPMGWIALVSCSALALAAYAIASIVAIVHAFKL